jgi:formyltetrahydrofolate-dependent phosphoribosylglycinamide formyltransferase
MTEARLVVMASGGGSNLQAIIDGCADGRIAATVAAVVTNVASAGALARAQRSGIPVVVLAPDSGEARRAYDERLAAAVAPYEPAWVVLAGWMRVLTSAFLDQFPGRVVNLHPALPGELPGLHAIERAYDEARSGRRAVTGVMVHLVPDEGVDDGPVLATATVPIHPNDTLAALEERVHAAEHALLVTTIGRVVAGRDGKLLASVTTSPTTPPTTPTEADQ